MEWNLLMRNSFIILFCSWHGLMIPLIKKGIKLGKARLAEVAWEDPREQSVYAVEGELVLLNAQDA